MNTKVTDLGSEFGATSINLDQGATSPTEKSTKRGDFEAKDSPRLLKAIEEAKAVSKETVWKLVEEETRTLLRGGHDKEEFQKLVDAYVEDMKDGEPGKAAEALVEAINERVEAAKDVRHSVAPVIEHAIKPIIGVIETAVEKQAEATANLNDDKRVQGQAEQARDALAHAAREANAALNEAISHIAALQSEMAGMSDIVPSVADAIDALNDQMSQIQSIKGQLQTAAALGNASALIDIKNKIASVKSGVDSAIDTAKTEMGVATAELKSDAYHDLDTYWKEYTAKNRELMHAAAYGWEDGYTKWAEGQAAREQIVSDFIKNNPQEAKRILDDVSVPKIKNIISSTPEPQKAQMGVNLSEVLQMQQLERFLTDERLADIRDIVITEVLAGADLSNVVLNSNGQLEGKGTKAEKLAEILKSPEFVGNLKAAKAEIEQAAREGREPNLSADQQNAIAGAKGLKAGFEHMMQTYPDRTLEELIEQRADSPEQAKAMLDVARAQGLPVNVPMEGFKEYQTEMSNQAIKFIAKDYGISEARARELVENGEVSTKELSATATRTINLQTERNIAENMAYERAKLFADASAPTTEDGIILLKENDPEWNQRFSEAYEKELEAMLIDRSKHNADLAQYVEVTYDMTSQELANKRAEREAAKEQDAIRYLDPDANKDPKTLTSEYHNTLMQSQEGKELIAQMGEESATNIMQQRAQDVVAAYVTNRQLPDPKRMGAVTKEAYERYAATGMEPKMALEMAQYEADQATKQRADGYKSEQAAADNARYNKAKETLKTDPANAQALQVVQNHYYSKKYDEISGGETLVINSPEDIAADKQAAVYAKEQMEKLTSGTVQQNTKNHTDATAYTQYAQSRIGGTHSQQPAVSTTAVGALAPTVVDHIAANAANGNSVGEAPEEKAKREAEQAVADVKGQVVAEEANKKKDAKTADGKTTVAEAAAGAKAAGTTGGESTDTKTVEESGTQVASQAEQKPDELAQGAGA